MGERGHNAGQGRGVSTSKPPASGSGHMPGAGTGKKKHRVCPLGRRGASQVVLVVRNLPANVVDIRDTGSIPVS